MEGSKAEGSKAEGSKGKKGKRVNLDNFVFQRKRDCFAERVDMKFFVDFFDVGIDGEITDTDLISDHFVTEAIGEVF